MPPWGMGTAEGQKEKKKRARGKPATRTWWYPDTRRRHRPDGSSIDEWASFHLVRARPSALSPTQILGVVVEASKSLTGQRQDGKSEYRQLKEPRWSIPPPGAKGLLEAVRRAETPSIRQWEQSIFGWHVSAFMSGRPMLLAFLAANTGKLLAITVDHVISMCARRPIRVEQAISANGLGKRRCARDASVQRPRGPEARRPRTGACPPHAPHGRAVRHSMPSVPSISAAAQEWPDREIPSPSCLRKP